MSAEPELLPVLRRFIPKVAVGNPSECWLWKAKRGSGRGKPQHGQFWWGRYVNAQRAAHILFVGPIPEGLHVLHRCDVPHCVNPSHLFLGTHRDNIDDMVAKGRAAGTAQVGIANGRARLSEADVMAVLAYAGRYEDIAKRFGVGKSTIAHIKRGTTWKHLHAKEPGR